MKKYLYAIALASTLLSGCALLPADHDSVASTSQEAAEDIARQFKHVLGAGEPIVVTTVVSLDNLKVSSKMGRLISEQVSASFARMGIPVVEPKMRGALYISSNEGELILSREVRELSQSHQARIVVVGTYTAAKTKYFVTLKAVDINQNTVVAAHTYEVSNGEFADQPK